jgi:hypothetical protein
MFQLHPVGAHGATTVTVLKALVQPIVSETGLALEKRLN